jgi:hypothetical protein
LNLATHSNSAYLQPESVTMKRHNRRFSDHC